MASRFLRDYIALLCLAAFVFCVVVARACLQSVTLDEADSFLGFAWMNWPSQWYPSSGNHVLNSILERLSATIFGVNELTLRLPAVLGAAVYIASAFYLCVLITERKLVRLILFVCLTFNPLVLDYLVAARGYSLAVGFLLAALAIIAAAVLTGRDRSAWASVFLALSFCANFSFAVADGLTMMIFFLWSRWRRKNISAIPCFLPGLAVAFLICGHTVRNWPKGQLYFGAQSLFEMARGLSAATFDDVNPEVLNPWLASWFGHLQNWLPWIAILTIIVVIAHQEIHKYVARAALLDLLRLFVSIFVLTILAHWLMFIIAGIPLPKDRTALFLVPLLTLAFGTALAINPGRFPGVRTVGVAVALLIAVYFVAALRIGHFKEWKFDADSKQLYWAVDDLNRRCGITEFVTDWKYPGVLNFYRISAHNHSIKPFVGTDASHPLPADKRGYIISYDDYAGFLSQPGLETAYHNSDTGAAVIIRGCQAR